MLCRCGLGLLYDVCLLVESIVPHRVGMVLWSILHFASICALLCTMLCCAC